MKAAPPARPAAPASAERFLFDAPETLPALTLRASLLGPESARLALRCRERQLLDWVLDGNLEWAFDFRRAGARRSHLRILAASILGLQRRNRALTPREQAAQWLHPFPPVFDSMFAAHKKFLTGAELARVWNCSPAHIHNLMNDGLLEAVRKYAFREARQFARETVQRFMQSRRVK